MKRYILLFFIVCILLIFLGLGVNTLSGGYLIGKVIVPHSPFVSPSGQCLPQVVGRGIYQHC